MKSTGAILMAIGVTIVLIAFIFQPGVEASGALGLETVFNLQRGQIQMMLLNSGLAGFIGGTILFGFGSLYELAVAWMKANGFRVRDGGAVSGDAGARSAEPAE